LLTFQSLGGIYPVRAITAFILLSGCTSLPTPMRDNANGNHLSSTCWRAAQEAKHGNNAAFHECFYAAYSRVRDPLLGGEDLESIIATLQQLLSAVGDRTFATQLAAESPPIRSGVSWFLRPADLQAAPETKAILAATRDYDFELERSIRPDQ
jgi:hypothetical protein